MITCEKLSKSFAARPAIREVSLQVDAGIICGLVGPDGAGKTTLMRMICGLIAPDAGQVWLANSTQRDLVHEKLGYMPQNFSLYGDLTVRENIDFFAAMYRLKYRTVRERSGQILAITRLEPFTERLASQLSGGMKQKLALSIALITRPAILILDEPTYGVDPESRKEFWQILYTLNQEGMTILMSTPYMDEAELCQQVALINQGQLVTMDSPSGLKARLGQRLLEVRIPVKNPRFFDLLPAVTDSSFFGDHYRLLVENLDSGRQMVEAYLLERQVEASSIQPATPSMEDVFIFLAESGGV